MYGTLDYRLLRERVVAGQIAEIEPNTFVDQHPDLDEMDDNFLPHHYCDEEDLRDLLRSFEIIRLWTALRQSQDSAGMRGKWVASVRRPLTGCNVRRSLGRTELTNGQQIFSAKSGCMKAAP